MNKKTKLFIQSLVIFIVIIISLFQTAILDDNTKNIHKREVDSQPINSNSNLLISYLDVGQADSILISLMGHYMLVDAGNNEDGEKLVSYFKALGIEKFDYIIATHAHEDHIGGMDDIINNFDFDNFYMPDAITTTKTFEDMLDALASKNKQLLVPEKGEELDFDAGTIKILYTGTKESDLNDTSIVFILNFYKNHFLFMGDATKKVEETLLDEEIKSDVLKVSHHGSYYSTTFPFLEKVRPEYAIISVAEGNIYNHPSEETLQKLEKVGSKIYRTDVDGTIHIKSDGDNISVQTEQTDLDG